MSAVPVTIGGRRFAVPPLRLRQIRLLLDALDAMQGRSGGALVEAAARVIHAGLSGDCPELTVEAVLDLPATMDEINAAVAAIIAVAGLVPRGPGAREAQSGEAQSGEAQSGESQSGESQSGESAPGESRPVAASPTSMAPSPPAAAMPTRSST
jgi:hypothetical protein